MIPIENVKENINVFLALHVEVAFFEYILDGDPDNT